MTTTTSAAPGRALLFIPGTLFWVLVIAGIVTENNALIGAGVVLLVVTVVLTLARKLRAGTPPRTTREKELWTRGTPARARVVRLTATGARLNHDPEVELELEVALPDQEPHRVSNGPGLHLVAGRPARPARLRDRRARRPGRQDPRGPRPRAHGLTRPRDPHGRQGARSRANTASLASTASPRGTSSAPAAPGRVRTWASNPPCPPQP
jgi:hypothetical protein